MKKTLTVNISGIVFHIDEDAYDKLNIYLLRIRSHFTTAEGGDEIMTDIESRIAEMLQGKISGSKEVITLGEVLEVIHQLGDPEQIGGGEEHAGDPKGKIPMEEKHPRRLYRDPDNAILGGVAGGLGIYFQIDPVWIRILFVLLALLSGFGILTYLILWIVVPKARTTAEKLEMKGEQINVSNIEKTIREEYESVKKNLKDLSAEAGKSFKKKSERRAGESILNNLVVVVGDIFRVFFRVVAVLIGLLFLIVGFSLIMGFIWSLAGGPVSFGPDFEVKAFSLPALAELILTNQTLVTLAVISMVLIIGVPLLVMIYAGVRLIFGLKANARFFGWTALALWLGGLGLGLILFFSGLRNFTTQRSVVQETVMETTLPDTLYLDLNHNRFHEMGLTEREADEIGSWNLLWASETNQRSGIPRLQIHHTTNATVLVVVKKEARGMNPAVARRNAESISYAFTEDTGRLIFDPFFSFDKEDGWRAQKVEIDVYVPATIPIIVSDALEEVVDVRWHFSKELHQEVQEISREFLL